MSDEDRNIKALNLESSLLIALKDLETLKELYIKTGTYNFPNKRTIVKNILEGIVYAAVNLQEAADKLHKF